MVTLNNIEEIGDCFNGSIESFTEAIQKNMQQKSFDDIPLPKEFKEITDLNWISFGHFITLEKTLAVEAKNEDKIRMIAPILIRPSSEEFLDNDNPEKERKHKELVEDLPIGTVYGCFNRFIEIRVDYLYKKYNGVIYGTLDDSIDDTDDEDEGTVTNSGVGAREGYGQKWFWYNLVGAVANGDIFRRQAAIELPMYEVMPFLAERRHLQIVENLEAKARR